MDVLEAIENFKRLGWLAAPFKHMPDEELERRYHDDLYVLDNPDYEVEEEDNGAKVQ